MKRSVRLAISLLLLSACPAFSQVGRQDQPEGRVVGIVVDQQNQPISGAQLCTAVSLPHETDWVCPEVKTDRNGKFQMEHLPMGTFGVAAQKHDDGYGSSDIQSLTLTSEAPLANVVIKMGPREGILAVSVKDKFSGQPLYNFMLSWHVEDTDQGRRGGAAGFSRRTTRTMIPAEKDVLVEEVSARGYKPGYKKVVLTDPSDPSRPLVVHLQRGEVRSLDIELEPEAEGALTAQ